ncbi:DUF397 domain-containing protein [Streptomyces sp. NPDC048219]|uniref:DUF397 domain-containing protein n=1 Tax=Streptomyces sp. NPDC048219 TaxID=3365517 RepID=UPI0037153E46
MRPGRGAQGRCRGCPRGSSPPCPHGRAPRGRPSLRDSKQPGGPRLAVTRVAWEGFVAGTGAH